MKKVLLFTFGLCSLFLITGCGTNENEEENYSVYEWHCLGSHIINGCLMLNLAQ